MRSLCPLGKDFMRELFAPTTRVPCGWSYGGYAKRRREGAKMQQCALRARLRASRVSHLGRSHDIRNAFASSHQLGTIGDSSKHLSQLAEPFVRQRVLEATISMPTPSGFCTVLHGAGGPPWGLRGWRTFSATYEPQVDALFERTSDPRPVAECPSSGRTVDTSLTAFVDDPFRILILDSCRASHAALTVGRNDHELDRGWLRLEWPNTLASWSSVDLSLGRLAVPFRENLPEDTSSRAGTLTP